jgi:hypothetical protein
MCDPATRRHYRTYPHHHHIHGLDPAMIPTSTDLKSHRPSLRRTAAEAVALIAPAPEFSTDQIAANAPKGDGHSVLVLPALVCGDRYTAHVRRFLTAIGNSTQGWNQGVNVGPTKRLLDGAAERLVELSDERGPVSLVGFSMGGMDATRRFVADLQRAMTRAGWTVDLLATA